jgi:hypothetical protein
VIASTVLHVLVRGQGSASGAGVSDTYVFVCKLRDGLVVEGWEYRTKQEALEAVGLLEKAMSRRTWRSCEVRGSASLRPRHR